MSEKPIREYDRFILRLPDGMRERLSARAKVHGRSMNSEITEILSSAIEDPQKKHIEFLNGVIADLDAAIEAASRQIHELTRQKSDMEQELAVCEAMLAAEKPGDAD